MNEGLSRRGYIHIGKGNAMPTIDVSEAAYEMLQRNAARDGWTIPELVNRCLRAFSHGRNFEREGDRDMTLSDMLRLSPGDTIRHLDVDFLQYCSQCYGVQFVLEATRETGFKPTRMTKKIARSLGATPLLVSHPYGKLNPIVVTKLNDGEGPQQTTWGDLQKALEGVHQSHKKTCSG